MSKRLIAVILAGLLAHTLVAASTPPLGQTPAPVDSEARLLERVRSKVARIGVGERARTTLWLKDGSKVKGYISQARDQDVVIRDRKTDAARPVFYRDIAKVDDNRGHGTAKAIGIGVGIGAAAVITFIAILFATLDD